MYKNEFIEAQKRSSRFGLEKIELLEINAARLLSDKVRQELPYVIIDKLGVLDENEIVLQCLQVNMRLKPVLSQYFSCPVYYTIGYVSFGDEHMFKQSEESLKGMLKHGIDGPSVNLHAWLTLPSMEILDFSLPTSYGRVKGIDEMLGSAIAMHPSELSNGIMFHPMLVGEEFLFKVGAAKVIVE